MNNIKTLKAVQALGVQSAVQFAVDLMASVSSTRRRVVLDGKLLRKPAAFAADVLEAAGYCLMATHAPTTPVSVAGIAISSSILRMEQMEVDGVPTAQFLDSAISLYAAERHIYRYNKAPLGDGVSAHVNPDGMVVYEMTPAGLQGKWAQNAFTHKGEKRVSFSLSLQTSAKDKELGEAIRQDVLSQAMTNVPHLMNGHDLQLVTVAFYSNLVAKESDAEHGGEYFIALGADAFGMFVKPVVRGELLGEQTERFLADASRRISFQKAHEAVYGRSAELLGALGTDANTGEISPTAPKVMQAIDRAVKAGQSEELVVRHSAPSAEAVVSIGDEDDDFEGLVLSPAILPQRTAAPVVAQPRARVQAQVEAQVEDQVKDHAEDHDADMLADAGFTARVEAARRRIQQLKGHPKVRIFLRALNGTPAPTAAVLRVLSEIESAAGVTEETIHVPAIRARR
jgi:hypothetical protein